MAKKKLKIKIKKKFVEDYKNEQITEKPNESSEYEEELSSKSIKSFDEKYYYHSKKSKIHISESEDGSFLISTYGMIIYNKRFNSEKEKIIYAFESQTEVLEILLEKVDQLLKKRNIYDKK